MFDSIVAKKTKEIKSYKKPSPSAEKFVRHMIQAGKYEFHDQIWLPKDNLSNHFSYKERPRDVFKRLTDKVLLFYKEDRHWTKMIMNKQHFVKNSIWWGIGGFVGVFRWQRIRVGSTHRLESGLVKLVNVCWLTYSRSYNSWRCNGSLIARGSDRPYTG